jgi:RNA polymerase-binding transcription factor DksA
MTAPGSTLRGSQEEFARNLHAVRERLLETIAVTEQELAGLEPPRLGGHGLTAAAATSVLSRLSQHERLELDEIAAAQVRLANGTYGICEACSRRIPRTRLRAMPVARRCVACQRKSEAPA